MIAIKFSTTNSSFDNFKEEIDYVLSQVIDNTKYLDNFDIKQEISLIDSNGNVIGKMIYKPE
jgi:hypothetical protein